MGHSPGKEAECDGVLGTRPDPAPVGLVAIEATFLGVFGMDRFYMGFSGLGLLKLTLFALSWVLYASVASWIALFAFVPFILFFVIDYFWVLAPALVGNRIVPFAALKQKATWRVAVSSKQSRVMQAMAALSMLVGIAVAVIFAVLL